MDVVLHLPGDPPQNALVAAAARGDTADVARLVASGIDVNLLNSRWGQTALHEAAEQGHAKVVALLIESGADLNILNRNGSTALMNACAAGHSAAALLLLDHGASTTVAREDGMTAYRFALWGNCKPRVLRALLRRGVALPEPGFRVIRLVGASSSLKQKALYVFLACGAIAWGAWIVAMAAIER
jgi:ankyrin repeat protein